MIRSRDTQILDNRYLYYALSPRLELLRSISTGAATKFLTLTILNDIEIDIPPLINQERIASILSAYDDLIENNTRRVQILEQMTQMLYREWFVNFRFPGHDTVKMLDSEMGMIPEGWEPKKLGDVLTLEYGKALKAEQRSGEGNPVYGSSGVVGYHSEKLATGPGIVVGRKGNVGSVFFSHSDFWVIDTAYYVSTAMSLHFIFFNLLTQNFLNNDAAVPGLNRNQAHSLPIVVPDKQILETFEQVVEPMFKMKNNLEKKNVNLRTTRDFLLPKLVSGEIEVPEAEPMLEAVTA